MHFITDNGRPALRIASLDEFGKPQSTIHVIDLDRAYCLQSELAQVLAEIAKPKTEPFHYWFGGTRKTHPEPTISGAEVIAQLCASQSQHNVFVEGQPPPDRLVQLSDTIPLPARFFAVPQCHGA